MYIYYATQARALGLHTYRWIHFRDAKERYRTASGDTRWERDDETGADGLSSSPASSSCTSTDYEVDTYVLGSVYPWITSFLLFLGCLLPLMSCRSVFYFSIYKGLSSIYKAISFFFSLSALSLISRFFFFLFLFLSYCLVPLLRIQDDLLDDLPFISALLEGRNLSRLHAHAFCTRALLHVFPRCYIRKQTLIGFRQPLRRAI